jgi:uncharacterized membrane protein
MEDKTGLLSSLFDKKTVEVLKKLLLKQGNFYIRDLSKETGVPLATTYRIVQKLVGLGVVEKKEVDKFVFYSVKKDSPVYHDVHTLVFGTSADPLELFKLTLKERHNGAFSAYKDKDGKIFIVSDLIKEADVAEIANYVFNKTQTKPNYIVVSRDFFQKMQDMNLINKEKLTLF